MHDVLKFARRQNSIQTSRADSHIRYTIKSNFSETNSVSIIREMGFHIVLMMEMELVSETLDLIIHLPEKTLSSFGQQH